MSIEKAYLIGFAIGAIVFLYPAYRYGRHAERLDHRKMREWWRTRTRRTMHDE